MLILATEKKDVELFKDVPLLMEKRGGVK